ncbi:STAS domain-containing protein, partial [bacterium]|nr:STAS domain-containing protein [bacterium]
MTNSHRLSLTEDLTIYHALDQKNLLLDALASTSELELDLLQVSDIDTAGLQLLILLKKEAQRAGKRVAIVRTGEGKAKAIGEVTIGEPMVVNKQKFRSLENKHHVPEGSAFDINTPTKHLYPMHDPVRYDEERDVGHGIVSRKVIEKAKGGTVKEPKSTVKAYKLFRVHPDHPGKLFP